MHNTYGFRVFLRVCGKYSTSCTHFSLIISLTLPPFLSIILAHSDVFLGRPQVYYNTPKPISIGLNGW